MSTIYFREADELLETVTLGQDETVLDGLLNSGVNVPFGCLTGVCQSCLLKSSDSIIPSESQKGLSESQKQLGYFLSCCCRPSGPMTVSLSNLFKKEKCHVLEKTVLSSQVVRLRINQVLCYRPGQYLTLWKNDEIARTYSIASHPTQDDFIEFHIRLYEDGVFSQWAFNTLEVGDELEVQGPMGECFYSSRDKNQPLLLAGIGTGLAPLYGILRDALLSGHAGRILLLIGAKTEHGLYYQDELKALQFKYPQLEIRYSIAVSDSEDKATQNHASDIYSSAKELMPDLTGARVYLCGGQDFVRKMRKQSFLLGANMTDISSDTFLCFPKANS